jgi:hypothetical protein
MNPTRPIDRAPVVRPSSGTSAVSLTGERRTPLPRLEPDVARVRPLDRDAALRILIDEVKSALIERFGPLPNPPAPAHAAADGSSLLSDLARLLHTLLADRAGENMELADATLALAEEAVHAGGQRAIDTIASLPVIDASVRDAVEQMRWLLVRMVDVQARTLRKPARRRGTEATDADSRLQYEVERDLEDEPD